MDKKTLSKEIYKRFNVVKRARNCFLYTKKAVHCRTAIVPFK